MKEVIIELQNILQEFSRHLNNMTDAEFSLKPSEKKWSKKEVLGHLIDSAHNNLRRFICGQYEAPPPKIIYDQDFWVKANGYQEYDKENVINLWYLVNTQIIFVLRQIPEESFNKVVETSTLHTLEWLAVDYIKHLKHHMNQIFPKSFDLVYP